MHTLSSGSVQHRHAKKNKKKKRTEQLKGFAFLNVPAHVEIIKLDGIGYKNQAIKIEKARIQCLSKPHEATFRPSPAVNNYPENQDVYSKYSW